MNLDGRKSFAEFEYTFTFRGEELVYRYEKSDFGQLLKEHLFINDKEVIYYDFSQNGGFTLLRGSETLNESIKNDSPISRVKYVSNNSILLNIRENTVFSDMMQFVNKMLLFYSLDDGGYQGFMSGRHSVSGEIIEKGRLSDFQEF